MAANKLQEAITLIKSGDKQAGQKLLTEVLNADPKNETAWLWMSALVTGEKRRFCLEKVLSINPNHPQAREQLAKLTSPVPPAVPAAAPATVVESPPQSLEADEQPASEPEPAPVASRAPIEGMPLPKVWLVPGKYLSNIIYLEGNNLLALSMSTNKGAEVLEEVRLGVTPKQLEEIKKKFNLVDVNHISLPKVSSVTLFGDSLKIVGTDKSGREKKISTTVGEENSETILKTLHERLGSDFQRITRPISRLQVMMSAIVLFTITICGTGFFWWFVRGLQAEVEAAGRIGGNARARGIATLLLLIGPNGFLCIGGLLMIIVIALMISALRKPPEETVLTRTAGPEKTD